MLHSILNNFCKYKSISYNTNIGFLIIILFGILFSSCEKDSNTKNNIFKYNEYSNISSLDPAFSSTLRNIWPVNQIFNGLVQLDKNLEIKGDIASSWTISEDKRIYTFKIRQDVYFHKSELFGKDLTRKVNAKDFEYSFNRLKDNKVASPGYWVFNNVKDFKAINDTIFQIELKKEFDPFLGILSMKYCSVVPYEIIAILGDEFSKKPIGTGPFKFKKWDENVKLVLSKNKNYFEYDSIGQRLPYLDGIAISFIPDKKSEFMELLSGRLDMVSSPENSIIDQIFDYKGDLNPRFSSSFNLLKSPYLNTEYIGFNTQNNIKKDTLLRSAINSGIDRKKMMQYLRKNIGYPAESGIVPNGLNNSFYLPRYSYDPELSKKLISIYKSNNNINEVNITIVSDSQYLDILEFIQSELQKVGIQIKIEITPPSILRQGKANGNFDAFRASWIADYPHVENYFSLFYSKNHTPKGPNYTFFSDRNFDELYELIGDKNSISYQKISNDLENIIRRYSPIIPLYYDMSVRIVHQSISGLEANAINQLNLKRVVKKL
ncbi:MAG: ABC transporter substrate-binding protein [Flavobacteriaceae bacterium]|nr:ABC transporter substrate-binding protein [Flavobacteriaceae bacterium]